MAGIPLSGDSFILGLDVGGTKLAAGVATTRHELKLALRQPTPKTSRPEKVLDTLVVLARRVLRQAGVKKNQVVAAGLSMPGPLDMARGVTLRLPNMPGWEEFAVRDYLQAALSLPVVMENDANAAALGEYHLGGHTRASRFVYFTLSTGLGSGFLIDGRIYRGAMGGGTEFGHLNLYPGGHTCGCGAKGCFEAYCSGTSIARRAREALRRSPHKNQPRLTTLGFFQAVERGEAWATALCHEIAQDMGRALGTVVNILGPDRIVLGGGVANQWRFLQTEAMNTLKSQVFDAFFQNLEVFVSTRPDDIALLGAAVVAGQTLAEALY